MADKADCPGSLASTGGKSERQQHDEHLHGHDEFDDSPRKRVKLEHKADPEPDSKSGGSALVSAAPTEIKAEQTQRRKGVAPIKKEYLVNVNGVKDGSADFDDDAAEAGGKAADQPTAGRGGKKTKGGQNHARSFGTSRDTLQLCKTRAHANELTPDECPFGDKCKLEHDLRKYLRNGKREDLQTFNGLCPLFEAKGRCKYGWKCRFTGSHSKEVDHDDGKKELVQIVKVETDGITANGKSADDEDDMLSGVVNIVSNADKITLRKKKVPTPRSEKMLEWISKLNFGDDGKISNSKEHRDEDGGILDELDNRAAYTEPPLLPSEKRRLYYGPETPVLAPLTTQGNLPFRQLCVKLGAQITWSEMAMGLPLLQGEKQEWALMKAHESELTSPAYNPKNIVYDYDNGKDIRFGAQIAANKPWLALKTTEVLTKLCPNLRAIDLNCGCPIDLVFRQGAGSALLDTHGKLEKILRGMNTVSGEVPITVKIRMGTKDKSPTAEKLCQRLVLGGMDAHDTSIGPAGVAAITLHGRSRQQRYSRSADWEYIAECANLVKKLKAERAQVTDTAREPDARDLPNTKDGLPYFCGNGDILSHTDYTQHIENAGVDSIMIGRGALVKPWVFEEIEKSQYLDKSATERLGYVEQFCRNGLEYWGSDEIGIGQTRRFLLEWLSFTCRYVPLGILEYLPPKFGDRPPAFRGRSELETLLASPNYKDWIVISEMFLGKAPASFKFEPKHKSNSYEIEAEG